MTRVKYVSVHESEDGEKKIKPGKGDKTHETLRLPTPNNDLESMQQSKWQRVDYWELPDSMSKTGFKSWWNDNVGTDNEPEPIDSVLVEMGERES